MFCRKCGHELKDSSVFCTQCGAEVVVFEDAEAASVQAAEPAADVPVQDASVAPNQVATPVSAPVATSAPVPIEGPVVQAVPTPKKKNIGAIVGWVAGVFVAAAVGFGVYQLFFAQYELNEKTIPDPALRSYIAATLDTDNDGKVTRDEAKALDTIKMSGSAVSDLSGMELFPNIVIADFSDCTNLVEANLGPFEALETLDASGSGLQQVTLPQSNLAELDISGSKITQIDLSTSPELKKINASETPLTAIDASSCGKLEELDLHGSPVADLVIGGKETLKKVDLSETKITGLDASGCTALESLNLDGSSAAEVKVNDCTALKDLRVGEETSLEGLESAGLRERWVMSTAFFSSFMAGALEGFPNGIGGAVDYSFDYEFDYDEQNRVVLKSLTQVATGGGVELGKTTYESYEYEYDGDSAYPSTVIQSKDDGSLPAWELSYDGSKLVKLNKTPNDSDPVLSTYEYDENGRCVEFCEDYVDRSHWSSYAVYDDKGNVSSVWRDSKYGEQVLFIGQYDDSGRIVKAGSPFGSDRAVEFVYNESGRISEMRFGVLEGGDLNKDLEVTNTCTINYEGDKPVSAHMDYPGENNSTFIDATMQYDEHGNAVRVDYHMESGTSDNPKQHVSDNYAEFSYARVVTGVDDPDVFLPIAFGNPAGHMVTVDPYKTWNPMEGQDPVAERFCNAMIFGNYLI